MPPWRIQTLAYPVPQVFEAAVAAASDLGLGISQMDRADGHLYLSHPRRLGRRDWPVDVAVTDSGLGTTVLRVAWQEARASAWPGLPRRRCIGRLCTRIRKSLEAAGLRPA